MSNLRKGELTFAERFMRALRKRKGRATVRRLSWDLGTPVNTVVIAANRLEKAGTILIDRPTAEWAKSSHHWYISEASP